MKKRKSKEILFVCSGKDCKKRGAKEVHKALKKAIDEQGLKKRVRIAKCHCLDFCSKGPIAIHGNTIYQEIEPMDAKELLAKIINDPQGGLES